MPRTIVIVDNCSEVRYLLASAMTIDGRFDVVADCAARDAERVVVECRPDALLVDVRPGVKNDLRLLERLASARRSGAIVVALTTGSCDNSEMLALAAGADLTLSMRSSTSRLLDELAEVLDFELSSLLAA